MTTVVGIDLSLSCSGVAVLSVDGAGSRMHTETFRSSGTRRASLVDRHARITDLGAAVVAYVGKPDLAVIEGTVPGSIGGSPVDRYASWWFVVGALIRREVPVAVMSPKSMKLAIAASGNADKAAVAVALERLWPGMDVSSSDVSDAAGLAHLGAVRLSLDVPTLERHRQVKWTDWPESLAEFEAVA